MEEIAGPEPQIAARHPEANLQARSAQIEERIEAERLVVVRFMLTNGISAGRIMKWFRENPRQLDKKTWQTCTSCSRVSELGASRIKC